jgi:Protein of unknown function (DUF1580)
VIDSHAEQLITLREAAATLPCRRAGKKTSVATLYRWAATGCRGCVLETLQVGGSKLTSRQDLQRFFVGCTNQREGLPPLATRTTAARERAIAKAEKTLEKLGV